MVHRRYRREEARKGKIEREGKSESGGGESVEKEGKENRVSKEKEVQRENVLVDWTSFKKAGR